MYLTKPERRELAQILEECALAFKARKDGRDYSTVINKLQRIAANMKKDL